MLIYIGGSETTVGKSSVCLGLLSAFLKLGYAPEHIGYIKPVTQCVEKQWVSDFCEANKIAHHSVGPIVFDAYFTRRFIDGEKPSSENLQKLIVDHINQFKKDKKIVVVDGVGYPAVGSFAHISNAEVAALIKAPVLYVGHPGIGHAIDKFNLDRTYFQHYDVPVIGVIYNNVEPSLYARYQDYLSRYFQKAHSEIKLYGLMPKVLELKSLQQNKQLAPLWQPFIDSFLEHIDYRQIADDFRLF